LGEKDDPYMYPSSFVIRNTFIDGAGPTFDEFYRERAARSCPASKVLDAAADTREASQVPVLFDGDMPSKNTFVHFPVQHISLDASEERQTKSCPSSGIEIVDDQGQFSAESTTQKVDAPISDEESPMIFAQYVDFGMDMGSPTDMQADLYFPGAAMPMIPMEEHFPGAVMPMDDQFMQMMWVGMETSQPSRPVLSLAEALPEPEVGSPEMPSVGSVGHWDGNCKPCAFMARGCSSGVNCPFCHLCDMNEKKRRRKDKISFMRELRRWKKEQSASASADQHM